MGQAGIEPAQRSRQIREGAAGDQTAFERKPKVGSAAVLVGLCCHDPRRAAPTSWQADAGESAGDAAMSERLTCVECGRVSREKGGWTARLTDDDEVVVYCPECDEREVDRA